MGAADTPDSRAGRVADGRGSTPTTGPLMAALAATGRTLGELLVPCPVGARGAPSSATRTLVDIASGPSRGSANDGPSRTDSSLRSFAAASRSAGGSAPREHPQVGAAHCPAPPGAAPTVPALAAAPALAPTPWPTVPQLGSEVWDGVGNADREAILTAARERLGTPWPQLLLSHYARYWRDGNRTQYEERLGEIRHRLALATLATLLGPPVEREAWLDDVADGVILLCEATTWCWSAHERFAKAAGVVSPSPRRPYIDLGAGEAVGELAWVHYVLGEALDARAPGVRARIVAEARARVLDPFRTEEWGWKSEEGREHNWNPWIHSNILIAALLLEDVPSHRAELVRRVLRGLDRYLLELPADGGIDEGYSYWWQGVGRCLDAVDQVAGATRGAVRVTDFAPLVQAARFPYRMQWSREWFVNVADGSARPLVGVPWHVMHRWGRAAGDGPVCALAASYREPDGPTLDVEAGLGRALVGLSDTAWAACRPQPAPLPRWVWLPHTQVAVARPGPYASPVPDAGPSDLPATASSAAPGLGFALKGGHNAENHNHCDVGTVTVSLDGVPYVVDAGQPTYTAQTFGPDRYSIWIMQSDWHSVPQPCGVPQSPGRAFSARSMEVGVDALPDAAAAVALDSLSCGGDGAATAAQGDAVAASLDLAGAYSLPGLKHWERRVRVDAARTAVTITDTAQVVADFEAPERSARPAGDPDNRVGDNQSRGQAATLVREQAALSAHESAELPQDGRELDAGSGTPLMTVHYLLAGNVSLAGPGCAHVTGPVAGRRTLQLAWDPDLVTGTLERRDLDDPLLTRVWGDHLTRLTLTGTPDARNLQVVCTALEPAPSPSATLAAPE